MRTSALVLCSLLAAGPAAAKFDPAHTWRTIRTAHFAIHYHEGGDELAGRAATIAEEVQARLSPRVGWTPRARTQLILADDDDAAGGWATPYPYNQILITPTAPLGEFGLGTTRHDDWLRLVITHEYTHVLQLDMASRLPLGLRSVFGRLYFPNALQPSWLIEGLATFEETELTPGGRGRSPGSEMYLRMAALAGRFPTLDQMAVRPDAWPAGEVPYLFGESFLRHLAARFGRERVAALSRVYGGRSLPFLVEDTGRRVLGEDYRTLWREWLAAVQSDALEQQHAVAARGLTAAAPLTADGRFNGSPAWSPDGRRLAWLRADARGYPGVWIMDADGSNMKRLIKNAFSTTTSAATLCWSPDGSRLYYTKQGFVRGAAVVNDLWAWDFGRGREIRLTRGLRARDPHASPDGRTLALVTAARGLTRLSLLSLDGPLPAGEPSRLRHLTPFSADQYAEPRWSPDGLRLAVSVWMPGGEKEIRVLDRAGSLIARVGHERALDGAPAWSPDGRRLYFSSDVSGIFNLYAWDAATGGIAQATNVLGGAFSPAPSPDGRRLAFAEYTARGFDIRVLELARASAGRRGVLNPQGSEWSSWMDGPQRQDPAVRTGTAVSTSRYSPLDTILPRLWFPWWAASPASGTLAGLITGGQDVLQRHRYTLTALYGPESGRLMHLADYAYDGLRPTLRLYSWDFDRTYGGLLRDAGGAADYTERARSLGAEATLAFPGFDFSQAITAGYRYRELSGLTPLPPWDGYGGTLPAIGSLGSARLGWAFSSASRQSYSISPEDGRRISLGLERYQRGLGSDRSFTRATLDWSEYLALPAPRHVLVARAFLGGAAGDAPPQGAFSLGGDAPGDIGYALDDEALSLRGFAPGTFRGERAVLAGLEYRFPLLEIGRGGVSAPFFLRRLHGALFVDAGGAWNGGGVSTDDLHAGIGAEVRLDLLFSYFLPATVRLGIAAGLDERGGVYPTLGLWLPQGLLGGAAGRQER